MLAGADGGWTLRSRTVSSSWDAAAAAVVGVGGGGAAPDARRREQHQPRHEDGDAGAVERHVVRPGRVRQPAYNTTTTGLQHERDDNRRAYNTTTTGLQHDTTDLPHTHDDNQTDAVKVAGSPHSTAERGENVKS